MKQVVEHDKSWKDEKKIFLKKVQLWDERLKDCFEVDNQPYVHNGVTKAWSASLVSVLISDIVSDMKNIFAALSVSSKKAMLTDLCSHSANLYCELINSRDIIKGLEKYGIPALMSGMMDLLCALYYPIIHPFVEFFLTYYAIGDDTFKLCAPIISQRRKLFLSFNNVKKICYTREIPKNDWRSLLFKDDLECCFVFFKKLTSALVYGDFSLDLFWTKIDKSFEFSCMQERYKGEIGLILQCLLCTFLEKNPTIYTDDFNQKSVWEKWYKNLDASVETFFGDDIVFFNEETTDVLF